MLLSFDLTLSHFDTLVLLGLSQQPGAPIQITCLTVNELAFEAVFCRGAVSGEANNTGICRSVNDEFRVIS